MLFQSTSSLSSFLSYSMCCRLNKEIDGGAWCPKKQVSKETNEFLQVNFKDSKLVTYIETQGRFGNSRGREYAEKYMLEYWRTGLKGWVRFKNRHGHHVSTFSKCRIIVWSNPMDWVGSCERGP